MNDQIRCIDRKCPSRKFCDRYTTDSNQGVESTKFDRFGFDLCEEYIPTDEDTLRDEL